MKKVLPCLSKILILSEDWRFLRLDTDISVSGNAGGLEDFALLSSGAIALI